MGPYGSVGAHIKTGRSPMAHDHFQTPPDPKMGYKNPKMNPKTRTSLIKGFHKRLPNLMLSPVERTYNKVHASEQVSALVIS